MSLEKDERETPQDFFDRQHARFRFTLDAAASATNAKLPRFNSLAEPNRYAWAGERVWVNPPYSEIERWVRHASDSDAQLVYMLVPNWTDRAWWQEHVEPFRDRGGALRTELLPRMRFLKDGKPILNKAGKLGSPQFGMAALIWDYSSPKVG